jgi:Filamin/ABP280 repeat
MHAYMCVCACACACVCAADVPVGKEAHFNVNTAGAGPGQPRLSVASPSGQPLMASVQPHPEGFIGKFVPVEKGPHTVHLNCADQTVPGSPFHITTTAVCRKIFFII